MKICSLLLALSILLFACNADQRSATPPDDLAHDVDTLKQSYRFNGVFSGTIPCADCPGINTIVEFLPDQTFYERMDYIGRASTFADSGTWKQQDSIVTVSFGAQSQNKYFGIMNDSTITMLDADKNRITGPLAHLYLLSRRDTVIHR